MYINRWMILSIFGYVVLCICLYIFTNAAIISVIFRLVNLAILVGGIAYLFYRNFYSSTKNMIHQEELKKESLIILRDELIDEEKQLYKKLQDQDQDCRSLLEKIEQWRSTFNERQQHYELGRKQAHMRAQQKAQKQSESLGRQVVYEQIIAKTVMRLRQDLQKRFSDVGKQQEFMKQLVNVMRKSES